MVQQITVLLLLLTGGVFAQQDTVIHVTNLRYEDYYNENDFFFKPGKLVQAVHYDRPGSVDEEFTYYLSLRFVSPDSLRENEVFDLEKDTGLVHCSFEIQSVWNWFAASAYRVSGTVTILRKTRREIILRENIRVSDGNSPDLDYVGERIFRKKKRG